MTEEDDRTRSEVRGAELRSELAATDARRAEEETAKAHEETEAAEEREEKLSRKEEKARQRAKAAQDEAERARKTREAEAAHDRENREETQSVSGARVASPGLGGNTDPGAAAAAARGSASQPSGAAAPEALTDRPEVLIGAAFAGAFVFAQVLKRLTD